MALSNASEWSLTIISSRGNDSRAPWQDFVLTNVSWNDNDVLFKAPIISDQAMKSIDIYVNILICGSVAAFGTVNNVINMIIFFKLGLKDSMSVGLMFLSMSDFFHSFLILVSRSLSIWEAFFSPAAFDPLGINYICFDWIRDIFYLCSGWTTTFLSIERCVCVVFPFKVKQIFTRFRCVVIVLTIYVVHVCIYMPVFVTQWLGWTDVEVDNGNGTVVILQRLVAVFSDSRTQVDAYVDIADGLPIISQIVVLVSVVLMIHGLRMSAKLRSTMVMVTLNKDDHDDDKKKQQSKSAGGMSSKNNRLVKVVLFLAIILTVCNIPRFVAAYVRHIHTEVMFGKRERNLFVLLWTLAILSTVINTSLNIFVYLIINSSYRARFKQMFWCA